MKIYPSLLEYTTEALEERIQACEADFPYMQIDYVDETFAQKPTLDIEEIIEVLEKFPATAFELHLMTSDLDGIMEYVVECDMIHRVIIHLRPYIDSLTSTGRDLRLESFPFQLGIAIRPGDSFETYETLVEHFPVIQIMTVNPGAQGGRFIESQLAHITHLREHGYMGEIILDGGINAETILRVMAHKHLPSAVCPGSYFREDVSAKLKKLNDFTKLKD